MTEVYHSALKRSDFFRRAARLNIEGLLSMDAGNGSPRVAGFISDAVWLTVFASPNGEIWASMRGGTKRAMADIAKELKLSSAYSYPYALESPESDLRALWEKKKAENPMSRYASFYESEFGRRVLKTESEYIIKSLGPCGSILDIGCGPGVFEKEIIRRLPAGTELVGIDNSEDMLRLARTASEAHFVLGNAERMPFRDSCFDCAFFVTSLEFMDYAAAVKEAMRVLKPGGRIAAILLNPESEYFREAVKRGGYIKREIAGGWRRYAERGFSEIASLLEHELGEKGRYMGLDKSDNLQSNRRDAPLYVISGSPGKKL